MFGRKTAEEEVIVRADRIASLKENFDALSWNRVSEIAEELRKEVSIDEKLEFARELTAISRANTDLFEKLGISANEFSGKMMPSGIEMLEEGIAIDPKRAKRTAKKKKKEKSQSDSEEASPGVLPTATEKASPGILPDPEEEPTDFFSSPSDESFIPRGSVSDESPEEKQVELTAELVMDVVSRYDIDIEPEVLAALLEELDPSEKQIGNQEMQKQDFARFSQIYSSKDGLFCLYRDGDEHMVAVDASKFA